MTKNFQQTPSSGIGVGDIAYVLLKHKWKLILISLLGLAGAAAYYFGTPSVYASQAKLMVRYVVERSAVDQVQNTTSLSSGQGEAVIQSELEILTSWDLAEKVGTLPGMEELVPDSNGPVSPAAAAGVIIGNLKASAVKGSNVIWVEFRHGNRDLCRRVLENLIQEYFKKHLEIHRSKEAAKFVSEKVEKSRTKLKGAEEELMRLKTDSGILSLPDAISAINSEGARVQSDLAAAESQLAEQRARVAALERFASGNDGAILLEPPLLPAKPADGAAGAEPANSTPPPAAPGGADPATPKGNAVAGQVRSVAGAATMASADSEYANAVSALKLLEAERMEMLKVYREEHYAVKELNEKITRQKAVIEIYKERSAEGSERRLRTALMTEQAQVAAIEARVGKLREALAAVQKNMIALTTVMPKISEKETARDIEAGNYKYMSASLEKAQVDEALDGSKMPNISIVQEATPAALDVSGRNKTALTIVGGTTGAAVGLTLLFGLILKRRVNRPQDLENRLGVPLLISIPYFSRNDRLRLLQPKGANGSKALNQKDRLRLLHPKDANGSGGEDSKQSLSKLEPPTAPWERGHFVRPYSEAIRDRLGLYFESKGITHKPKLIGVTGFSQGAGTSTLAAGLAAALSEIGEGKVLMVDMTSDGTEDNSHPFFAGRPAVALDDALKPAGAIQSTAENLYLATADPNSPGSGSLGLSKFRRIMRDLQASDYDYMVFDMPALSQTSSTAAMAGLMDQVLVIVEAEASSPEEVKRGFRDLVDSRAKVSVVFNKAQSFGPKALTGGH